MKKENVCVYISCKKELKHAKHIIRTRAKEDYIHTESFYLSEDESFNYLYFGSATLDWGLGAKGKSRTLITLSELDELLKQLENETTK